MTLEDFIAYVTENRERLLLSLGDNDLKEDALQEVCADVIEWPACIENARDAFATARTYCCRKLSQWQYPEEEPLRSEPLAAEEGEAALMAVYRVKGSLTVEEWETMTDALEELSMRDAGKKRGVSRQTILRRRHTLRQALEGLREELRG